MRTYAGLAAAAGLAGVVHIFACSPLVEPQRCAARWCKTAGGAARCAEPCRRFHESELGHNPSSLELAVAANGSAVIAWIEATSARDTRLVVAAESSDGEWSFDSPAELLAGSSLSPKVACTARGVCALVWAQSGPSGTFVHLATYANARWTRPRDGEALSFAPHSFDPQLAVAQGGEVLIVWNQHCGDRIGVALARRDAHGVVTRPRDACDVLSPPLFFSNDARVACNRRGDAVVSWYQSTGGSLRVFASERQGAYGVFSRPAQDEHLSVDAGGPEGIGGRYLDETVAAVAESGAAALAWEQPVAPDRVAVFMALRDAGGRWTTASSADDAFSSLPGAAWRPRVVFTERGDLYVAWIQSTADGATALLAHRSPDGSWSARGNEPLKLSTGRGRCESLEITASSDGTIAALWSERIDGHRRVFARRRSVARGEPGRWQAARELSASLAGEAYAPKVASGGPNGRVVAAWIQSARVRVAVID